MNTITFSGLVVGAALSAAVGAAIAAEPVGKIARIQGSAVVSQGAQYVVASEGRALVEGDRVMALEGGVVTLQFADGCQLTLQDNEVLTVGAGGGCNRGVDPNSAIARGPNGGGYLRRAAMEPPLPGQGSYGLPSWLIPAAFASVVAIGIVAGADDDDDDNDIFVAPRPPSP